MVNKNPLAFTEFFELKDLHSHNLKHIDVKIPKGVLTAICGVSGGGTDGGEVVFAGTPEEILKCEKSKTGKWIGKMM